MKFYIKNGFRPPAFILKFLLIMRLTFVLLITLFVQISLAGYSQKVTYAGKNIPLEQVFKAIQNQTGYTFLYTDEMLADSKPVSLDVTNAPIADVLKKCFENMPLTYTIDKNTVIIQRRYLAPPEIIAPVAITISGKVTDEKGEILPGVTITERGTNPVNATTTNLSGGYTLKVAGPNSTLVFTFVGFDTQEIKVGAQTTINVKLSSKASDLNEVVVVGYGTQKRVSLTGSIASIGGDEIIKTRNENVLNMLTGKLPGLRVLQTDAEPGNFSGTFDVRGLGTPLVIVDGVPRGGDLLRRLDPNDIESISILKDAAAAVYGVQAANGVVLVTTKKGKPGTARIQYTATVGFTYASGLPDPIGAVDWMNLKNEQSMHNIGNPLNKTYNQAAFDAFTSGAQQSTDWYSVAVKKTAPQTQHNLNISGGTENTTYFVSLGYLSMGGFYSSGDLNYNKYNVRSNITTKITKNLTIDLQMSGITDTKNQPYDQSQDLFKALWRAPPNLPVFANNNPAYVNNLGDNGVNSYATTRKSYDGYRIIKSTRFNGLFDVIYNVPFIPGLKAKGLFSYDYQVNDNNTYQKTFNLYTPTNTNGTIVYTPQAINSQAGGSSLDTRQYQTYPNTLLQASLDYNHTFGKDHNLQLLVVYEEKTTRTDNFSASRTISIPALSALSAGNAAGQTGSQSIDQNALVNTKSVISRLHYDYKSKYLIDMIGRYDGSSRFSPEKQFGFFPGVTAAWRISEENFIKGNPALSFIDNIKLRASYGKLGDDGSLSYQYIGGYNYPGTVINNDPTNYAPAGYVLDNNFVTSLQPRTAPNTGLFWTTTKTINFGLDAEFWKGLFGFSLDLFSRERDGLLANRILSLPGSYGTGLPQENLNSDRAQGVELSLSHENHVGKVSYSINANVTFTRNKLLHVEAAPSVSSYDNWLNNKNNRWNDVQFGYGAAGRFTSFSDVYGYPIESQPNNNGGNRSVLPGDYKYVDWNNDGYITTADKYPIANTTGQTNSVPLLYFGITPDIGYANFDLNATFQGAGLRETAYPEALAQPLTFGGGALKQFLDRWHPVDPNANQFDPHTQYVSGRYAVTGSNYDTGSGFAYMNGDYIRLKSIELGYTLPKSLTKKVGVQSARFYVNGYNILTFSYIKDVDPEKPSDQNGYRYPLNKTYNIGVNVTF